MLQIEGGFVQGQGLFTLEEIRFSQTGSPWTTGPGAYKIPGFADIPVEFNVHLLRSAPNEHAIYSSKVHTISYPESSGPLASSWSPGETLGNWNFILIFWLAAP